MAKIVRSTYSPAFSVGLLCLIFCIAFLLSEQVFTIPLSEFNENKSVYVGMFLVATAILIMVLILWEEFLFPITTKEVNGGMLFHNHRNKLQTQLIIYLFIPVIFLIVYLKFEINVFRYSVLAVICIVLPILEKLGSGVKNYNDFLRLTNEEIEYKDNEKVGKFEIKNIQAITIINHQNDITHQIELVFKSGEKVTIDLHEMELDEYYESIYQYMRLHYGSMLKKVRID